MDDYTISDSSAKLYLKNYKTVLKEAGEADEDKILETIRNSAVKDCTKLARLNAILGLEKLNKQYVQFGTAKIKEYRDLLNRTIKQARSENNLTDNQQKVMSSVTFDDVKGFVQELGNSKKHNKKVLEDYVLLKIMTEYPLRNDLEEVLVTDKKREDGLNNVYIPADPNENVVLSIHEYKTARTHGPIIIQFEKDLSNDIRELVKDNRRYLFVNAKGESYKYSGFTKRLQKLFSDRFGQKISTNVLRKMYLTNKYSGVFDDMKRDNYVMGHNMDTAQQCYIANVPTKDAPQPQAQAQKPIQLTPMQPMPVFQPPQQPAPIQLAQMQPIPQQFMPTYPMQSQQYAPQISTLPQPYYQPMLQMMQQQYAPQPQPLPQSYQQVKKKKRGNSTDSEEDTPVYEKPPSPVAPIKVKGGQTQTMLRDGKLVLITSSNKNKNHYCNSF